MTQEMSQFKKRQGWLSLIILFVLLKFAQHINNKTDTYQASCFSRCQYIPEALMQKNNMGVISNDMRIK